MERPKKYIKKPVQIEAIKWTGYNKIALLDFFVTGNIVSENVKFSVPSYEQDRFNEPPNDAYVVIIPTLEGDMKAIKGDYIIKGIKGEFYPCKPDIFQLTYQPQ